MTPRHLGQLVMMFAQRSQSWWAQGLGLHGFDDLQDEREQPLQDKWVDGVGDLQKLARPLPQFLQYPRCLLLPPMIFREQILCSNKPLFHIRRTAKNFNDACCRLLSLHGQVTSASIVPSCPVPCKRHIASLATMSDSFTTCCKFHPSCA